ncbi:MAG: sigma-54 dependent transcriptional regulator [Desulforhabdus sp.]|jgi:DNA-binding NtrC family response regulator|nr:sigma-54 dependent transcriptional regulator [Desulforhabdus sp.]
MKQGNPEGIKRILIVDDEPGARESLELVLEDNYEVETAEDGLTALAKIRQASFELVLLDVNMPKLNGIEVLKRIKEYDETIDVIMVSAADRAHEATASMKCGAYDYITKPFEAEEILATVQRAIEKRSLELEVRYLRSEIAFRFGNSEIVSRSKGMQEVFHLIDKVAGTSSSVLITGESGTGKELVARAIHAKSPRSGKSFVTINCAAIPHELIESELFGHEKGAFTGAHSRTVGKFEFANGGSIFLDEISSLKLELQAKLLRVLQEREFTRVGSHQNIKVDVRVIAATNTRLEDMIKAKEFRGDLYFRLNVIPLSLPPLREREGDIPLLCNYFLVRYNRILNKKIKGITPDAMALLEAYPWPGNVRELENMVERLVVLGTDGGWVEENDLPFDLLINEELAERAQTGQNSDAGLIKARQAFERQYVLCALQRCGWNQTDTARLLRIHRNTLIQKMKSLSLRPTDE